MAAGALHLQCWVLAALRSVHSAATSPPRCGAIGDASRSKRDAARHESSTLSTGTTNERKPLDTIKVMRIGWNLYIFEVYGGGAVLSGMGSRRAVKRCIHRFLGDVAADSESVVAYT